MQGVRLRERHDQDRQRHEGRLTRAGRRPRTAPPRPHGRPPVQSVDHAERLRDAAAGSSSAVCVGTGFLGCEVAATLRTAGVAVTLVGPECKPVAFGVKPAYGRAMPPTCPPLQHRCPVQAARRQVLLRPRTSFGQPDERFPGPQVPGENPVHWIAERAPPSCS